MRAKSLKGVKGNLGYIVQHKTWATLVVFVTGFLAGTFVTTVWCVVR